MDASRTLNHLPESYSAPQRSDDDITWLQGDCKSRGVANTCSQETNRNFRYSDVVHLKHLTIVTSPVPPLKFYKLLGKQYIQNKTYLVKGWQGGLIKIMSKDNLLKSLSVMPWGNRWKKDLKGFKLEHRKIIINCNYVIMFISFVIVPFINSYLSTHTFGYFCKQGFRIKQISFKTRV